MTQPNPLLQASEHLQAGRVDQARAGLIEWVRQNPNSEKGWFLLSRVLTDTKQQIDCLQRVLKLNPNNAEARERLTQLTQPPTPPVPSPKVSAFTTAALKELGLDNNPPPPKTRPTPPPSGVEWRPEETTANIKTPTPALTDEWEAGLRPATLSTPAAAPRKTGAGIPVARTKVKPPTRSNDAQLSKLIMLGGSVAIVGLIGLFLAIGSNIYLQRQRAAEAEVTRRAASVYASAVFPTLPPTFTITPTSTITATPTVRPPPTRTSVPTPKPPPTAVAAQMDIIQQQVADLRGLPIKGELQRYVIEKRKVDATLEELFLDSGGSRAQVDDEEHVLVALRLINPTFDLYAYNLSGISDGLGGFYTPWSKRLYVIGTAFNGLERFIYSHEYDHALTDSHFNIGDLGVYPNCTRPEQQCDAIRGLVEGDATLLMYQWLKQYATPEDYNDILRQNYTPSNRQLPDQFPPPFASRAAAFPYVEGYNFVETLYTEGNWAAVNRAYENLPTTTEQILHPEKYLAGEGGLPVDPVALDGVLGSEWRLLKSDTLGEWQTYLVLSYSADVASQVNVYTGIQATTGWGGDNYQVYYNDTTAESVLVAHWVWDTPEDAAEFKDALLYYQDQRFRGANLDHPGDCWEANNQTACVFSRDREQLWLIAPNQTLLNAIWDRYTSFR